MASTAVSCAIIGMAVCHGLATRCLFAITAHSDENHEIVAAFMSNLTRTSPCTANTVLRVCKGGSVHGQCDVRLPNACYEHLTALHMLVREYHSSYTHYINVPATSLYRSPYRRFKMDQVIAQLGTKPGYSDGRDPIGNTFSPTFEMLGASWKDLPDFHHSDPRERPMGTWASMWLNDTRACKARSSQGIFSVSMRMVRLRPLVYYDQLLYRALHAGIHSELAHVIERIWHAIFYEPQLCPRLVSEQRLKIIPSPGRVRTVSLKGLIPQRHLNRMKAIRWEAARYSVNATQLHRLSRVACRSPPSATFSDGTGLKSRASEEAERSWLHSDVGNWSAFDLREAYPARTSVQSTWDRSKRELLRIESMASLRDALGARSILQDALRELDEGDACHPLVPVVRAADRLAALLRWDASSPVGLRAPQVHPAGAARGASCAALTMLEAVAADFSRSWKWLHAGGRGTEHRGDSS